MRLRVFILFAALLVATSAAAQAPTDDYSICTRAGVEPPIVERFAVCNRVIEGGQYQGTELARALSVRGHALRLAGKHDEALRDYERAIPLQPDQSGGYFGRAVIRNMRGDLQGALVDGSMAIQTAPDAPEGHIVRGETNIRLGQWVQADIDLSRGLELSKGAPGYEIALVLRGYGRVQYNRPADAERDLNEAIHRTPGDVFAHRFRGLARLKLQSFERAAADFSRAIALKNEAEDYYNRGMALAYLSLPDRALADFDTAFRLAPKNSPGRAESEAEVEGYRKSVAAERQRDRDNRYGGPLSMWRVVGSPHQFFGHGSAVDVVRPNYEPPPRAGQPWLALLVEPSTAPAGDARIDGVMDRLRAGDTNTTMDEMDAAIRAGATADLYLARSRVWLGRAASSAALRDLDRAVEMRPDRADLYLHRGIAALREGQTRFAISNFQDALRRDPNGAAAKLNLAVAQVLADETSAARGALDRLLRTAPTAEALRIRGALLARLGDYRAAVSDLTQALTIQPADPLTLLLRARTLTLGGDPAAALADLQQVDPARIDANQLAWIRGVAQFADGQYGAAKDTFTAASAKGQGDAQADIVAHIAARRAGPADELIPSVPKGMETNWPRAVRFLFGDFGSADDVMDMARNSDRVHRPTRLCEATFFVAAWHAVEGRKPDALRGFEVTRKNCMPDDLLRAAALAEAGRLR